MMMSDLKRFETKLDHMSDNLMGRMVQELNQRDIGGGMHHATQIQEQLRELNAEFRNLQSRLSGGNLSHHPSGSNDMGGGTNQSQYSYFNYGGRYNLLPQYFVMPKLTLYSFISFYLLGNRDTGVPPLRLISQTDLKHSGARDGSKVNLKIVTDMKRMMRFVEEAGRDAGTWEDDPAKWDTAKVTHLYESTKH